MRVPVITTVLLAVIRPWLVAPPSTRTRSRRTMFPTLTTSLARTSYQSVVSPVPVLAILPGPDRLMILVRSATRRSRSS